MLLQSMTRRINGRFSVKLTGMEIATALGQGFLKSNEQLPEEMGEEQVIEALVRVGKLPDSALGSSATNGTQPSAGESPRRRRRGTSALVSLSYERPRGPHDDSLIEWMEAVIAADKAIRDDERVGDPYRPYWEQSESGAGILYEDPLSLFLEPAEFSKTAQDTGSSVNLIYANYEKIMLWNDHPDQSFQWRSNELIRKFEAKLLELWCARMRCRLCEMPLERGMWDEVKQLLRQEIYLPGTPNVPAKKILVYPEIHPWCSSIRKEQLRVAHAIQGREGDTPEAVAFRTAEYNRMITSVAAKHSEEGVTVSIVVEALKAIDRANRERSAAHAAS